MTNINDILQYMSKYGYLFLGIIVFLEYLNLPGLPAGLIMPAAGILVKADGLNFIYTLIISVIAGLLGSFVLYALGHYCGKPILNKWENKFPKSKRAIDKIFMYIDKYGNMGILISRIIPVARTLISLVAGTFNVKLIQFTLYSAIGITIWNFVFIYAGYAFGYLFLK
ncbi:MULTISPECIES: DedA family protein [unclassified Clostridium]|uniref:DedA family protein n=1 Tax=unclassified Clostridium TaxID=2614128 RepID=UPI001C8BF08F|nr:MULTISPECIES: DedA family protein [unclassified Clostridium]MBX9138910.1 DedA family protein [Clostridium sp. K12(2020)]MBX9145702.1 DedA family protein [Clostridium sp. K13]MDU2290898.1 DedA family protein [Clostridium celatum]